MHRTAGNHYGRNVYSCQSHKVSGQAFIAAGNVHAAVKWSCIGMNFNHIGNHFTACQTEIDSIGALTLAITDISSKVSRTMASGLRHTFTGCRHKLVQVAAAGVAVTKGTFYNDLRFCKIFRFPSGTKAQWVQLRR